MTTITIYRDHNKNEKGFEIKGHACFATNGKDIVCAAISILTQNTINSIETYAGDACSYKEDENSGYMKYLILNIPSEKADLLLKSLSLGLSQISQNYKKYVKLKFEEV